jgi:hypothetical protein
MVANCAALILNEHIIAISAHRPQIGNEKSALHQESAPSGKTDDRMLARFSLLIQSDSRFLNPDAVWMVRR